MDRRVDERNILYFYKHAVSSLIFLMVLTFAFVSLGYAKENGKLFIIIGIIFFGITVYQFISPYLKKVSGKELDESAYGIVKRTKLQSNAVESLGIDEDIVESAIYSILSGYCPHPIKTEPLFRFDKEDGRARSSAYQLSILFIGDDTLYTYTQVNSLVDKEYMDGSQIWSFKSIKDCRLDTCVMSCFEQPGQTGAKRDGNFEEIVIESINGKKLCFAVEPSQREKAEKTVEIILEKMTEANAEKGTMKKRNTARLKEKYGHSSSIPDSMAENIIGGELKEI